MAHQKFTTLSHATAIEIQELLYKLLSIAEHGTRDELLGQIKTEIIAITPEATPNVLRGLKPWSELYSP